MRSCAIVLGIGAAACRPASVFPCSSDVECVRGGEMGVCVEAGYCAFHDSDCPSGLRFGEYAAPDLAGECVSTFDSTGDLPDTSAASSSGLTTASTTSTSSTPNASSSNTMQVDEGSSTSGDECPSDWWDCAWTHRRSIELTFDGEPLDNFPVHVHLDADRMDFDTAAPNGADVRFVSGDEVLPHERVVWQGDAAELWVRVPSLGASGPIHLYWGNPDAPDSSDPQAVWANGYIAVLHMLDERDALGVLDLAFSGNVEPAPGLLGNGLQFDGVSGYLQDQGSPIDLFENGATVSVVFHATGWGEAGFGRIVDAADINTTATGWSISLARNGDGGVESIRFGRGHSLSRGTWYSANGSIALDTWVVAAVSYHDGVTSTPSFSVDGLPSAPVTAVIPDGDLVAAPMPVTIGALATTDLRFFAGIIDEIHFATVRSDDWLAAEQLSFTDQLLELGPVEAR